MNTKKLTNRFVMSFLNRKKNFLLLLTFTFSFVLFMASCSEKENEIVNTAKNISAEQTEFETYRGAEISFSLTFKNYWAQSEPNLIFKIDDIVLSTDFISSSNTFIDGTQDVKVKVPLADIYGAKQLKIYDHTGKFLTDGPKLNIDRSYMLAVVRDMTSNTAAPPFLGYWAVSNAFHGMCNFDGKSVIMRNNVNASQSYLGGTKNVQFVKFSFGEFTPDARLKFTYNIEIYKNAESEDIADIYSNVSRQIGLSHFGVATDYFSAVRKLSAFGSNQKRIFVSADANTHEAQVYLEGIITQPFDTKDIKDIEVTSTESLYALEAESFCIKKIIGKELKQLTIGSETESGYKDGDISTARFTTLVGISMGDDDNLYVAEANRIRKITSVGAVTTVYDKDLVNIQDIYAMKDGRIYVMDDNKIKILNKEHTQLASFSLRCKPKNVPYPTLSTPFCVSDKGIVYLFVDMYDVTAGKTLACLIPEEMVPDKTLEQFPDGMYLSK
jgi:hypothetical protein